MHIVLLHQSCLNQQGASVGHRILAEISLDRLVPPGLRKMGGTWSLIFPTNTKLTNVLNYLSYLLTDRHTSIFSYFLLRSFLTKPWVATHS